MKKTNIQNEYKKCPDMVCLIHERKNRRMYVLNTLEVLDYVCCSNLTVKTKTEKIRFFLRKFFQKTPLQKLLNWHSLHSGSELSLILIIVGIKKL